MALSEYTAEVRDDLLLELPSQARELKLKPGEKVVVQVFRRPENASMPGVKVNGNRNKRTQPKRLVGRGMLSGSLSTEEYLLRKRKDTEREDWPLR